MFEELQYKVAQNEMLKKVQDQIAFEEMWGARHDPLKYLPVELAESVLQYVPFRDLRHVFFLSLPLPCLTY